MKKLVLLLAASVLAAIGCAPSPSDDASGPPDEQASTGDAISVHVARHAIVLAHGFDGSLTNRWSFFKVADTLRADGHVVHEAEVSPYKSVSHRAAQLAVHVDAALRECAAAPACDATKVHIIAHSMGGLDSRFLISKLGYGDRVASLATISTPHRGSNIADVLVKAIPDNFSGAVNAMASVWGRTFTERDLAEGSDVKDALTSLSETYARETFNPEVKDDGRVTYLSWAGVSEIVGIPNPADQVACEGTLKTRLGIRDGMDPSLVPAAPFVAHGRELRPNDGVITVESAKWGKFMGCIAADHLDEVGQPKDEGNPLTGFDHLTFYRTVASSLDEEVAAHARTPGPR